MFLGQSPSTPSTRHAIDATPRRCLGEVLDLEDAGTPGSILCASPWEAGQADVIVITAGRGQLPGETRLELINGIPISVKDPTRECFLSIPTVVGVQGAESVLEIAPYR